MVKCGSKNAHQKAVCKKDWPMCSEFVNQSIVNIIVGGYVTVTFGNSYQFRMGSKFLRLKMASPSTFTDQLKCRVCKSELYFIANMKSNHCKTLAMGTKKKCHYTYKQKHSIALSFYLPPFEHQAVQFETGKHLHKTQYRQAQSVVPNCEPLLSQ